MPYAFKKIVGSGSFRAVASVADVALDEALVADDALPANPIWDGAAVRSRTVAEIADLPAALARTMKAAADAGIDRTALREANVTERQIAALMLLLLDEINRHSTFETALLAAIASATSLADLRTRAAAISPAPVQRTRAQVVAALKAKIAETSE